VEVDAGKSSNPVSFSLVNINAGALPSLAISEFIMLLVHLFKAGMTNAVFYKPTPFGFAQ
jgi:hypothetical protein